MPTPDDHMISRFPTPTLEQVPEDIRNTILAVQERTGFVPNVFLLLARRPEIFRSFFALREAVVEHEGNLSRAEREMIALTLGALNDCLYCVTSHGAALRVRARDPQISDRLLSDYRNAGLSPRQVAMLDFAVSVATRAAQLEQSDFDALAEHGFDSEDAWNIGSIAAFYSMSNRLGTFSGIVPNAEFDSIGR